MTSKYYLRMSLLNHMFLEAIKLAEELDPKNTKKTSMDLVWRTLKDLFFNLSYKHTNGKNAKFPMLVETDIKSLIKYMENDKE